ncbi:MAG: hypothetical protein ACKV2V_01670 [Blastocatellia bacterium]
MHSQNIRSLHTEDSANGDEEKSRGKEGSREENHHEGASQSRGEGRRENNGRGGKEKGERGEKGGRHDRRCALDGSGGIAAQAVSIKAPDNEKGVASHPFFRRKPITASVTDPRPVVDYFFFAAFLAAFFAGFAAFFAAFFAGIVLVSFLCCLAPNTR